MQQAKPDTRVAEMAGHSRGSIMLTQLEAQNEREKEVPVAHANTFNDRVHNIELAVNERVASNLHAAKDRGVVSNHMVADVAGRLADGPILNSVSSLPALMQVGFRQKVLGLLLTNLICVLLIMIIVTNIPGTLDMVDDYNWIPFICLVTWGMSLFMISVNKEVYPMNYFWLAVFTLALGAFLGLGHRAFNCHFNFQIVGYACVNIAIFQFCVTRVFKQENGQYIQMFSFKLSVLIAYLTTLGIAIAVQVLLLNRIDRLKSQTERVSVMIIAQIFTLFELIWFAYDTVSIEKRLTADDYMMGVICFYSDFVTIIMCCCCAACCCGMVQ